MDSTGKDDKISIFEMRPLKKYPHSIPAFTIEIDFELDMLCDEKPFNPTFIRKNLKELYIAQESDRLDAYQKIQLSLRDSQIKMQVPKSTFCCVCKRYFVEHYFNSEDHSRRITSNHFFQEILRLETLEFISIELNVHASHETRASPQIEKYNLELIDNQNNNNHINAPGNDANVTQTNLNNNPAKTTAAVPESSEKLSRDTIKLSDIPPDVQEKTKAWMNISSSLEKFNDQLKHLLRKQSDLLRKTTNKVQVSRKL